MIDIRITHMDTVCKLNVHKTSKDILNVYWTSYVSRICDLCKGDRFDNVVHDPYTYLSGLSKFIFTGCILLLYGKKVLSNK